MRKWALQVKRTSQPEPAAGLAGRQPNQPAGAARRRQHRFVLAVAVLAIIPSLTEAYAVLWGAAQGFTGRALRDGLDFWAGGCLALHHQAATVFNPVAYQALPIQRFHKNSHPYVELPAQLPAPCNRFRLAAALARNPLISRP